MRSLPFPLFIFSPALLIDSNDFFLIFRHFVRTQIEDTLWITWCIEGVIATDRRHEVSLKPLTVKITVISWRCKRWNGFDRSWGVWKPLIWSQMSQKPAAIKIGPFLSTSPSIFCINKCQQKNSNFWVIWWITRIDQLQKVILTWFTKRGHKKYIPSSTHVTLVLRYVSIV